MIPVNRRLLEEVARIVGPASAAAMALKDADSHNGHVKFWKHGKSIIVEKLPEIKDPTHAE